MGFEYNNNPVFNIRIVSLPNFHLIKLLTELRINWKLKQQQ